MNSTHNKEISALLNNHLDDNELDLLLKHSQIASYKPEELILGLGEKIEAVYLILEGQVLVTATIMNQGLTDLETLEPGQYLCPVGFIGCGPCPTSFKAFSSVKCLIIPRNYFKWLALESLETKYKLFQMIAEQICQRLKIIHDKVTAFISKSDMISLTFISKVIDSLNVPKKVAMQDYKEIIEQFSLFKSFSKAELEILLSQANIIDAPKNCKLISESEKNVSCYLVIYGAVQACVIQNNKQAKLSVIGPKKLLASLGCIEPEITLSVSYITCEQAVLCKFSEQAIEELKVHHPLIWYKLFNLICGSIAALKQALDKLNIRLNIEHYNR